jgi:DNA-binding GntR family transcriptional regulator
MGVQELALEDHLLQRHRVPASDDLAESLAVTSRAPLIHLKRVRFLGSTPLMLDSSYVPGSRGRFRINPWSEAPEAVLKGGLSIASSAPIENGRLANYSLAQGGT